MIKTSMMNDNDYILNRAFQKLMTLLSTDELVVLTQTEKQGLLQYIIKEQNPLYKRYEEIESLMCKKVEDTKWID